MTNPRSGLPYGVIRAALALALLPLTQASTAEPALPHASAAEPVVSRLAFGSCCRQARPIPIFDAVASFKPGVWVWMGDNIYGDTTDMEEMAAKYATLSSHKTYAALRRECTVIGTWDDHDYGENDAGKEYPKRAASQQCFLDFLKVPADHPRREQQGVYTSHTFGAGDRQLKVLLLDTRFHRDPPGPDGDILGEAQWRWLKGELRGSTAQVHLLVSSIQLVASDHRFEKWANFPTAKKRLMALLAQPDAPPVTVLSGDRHRGEISVEKSTLPYPLYDITSSSLNQPLGGGEKEVNRHRVGENFGGANFGTLEIDWDTAPPTLQFALRDEAGAVVRSVEIQQGR